MSGYGATLAYCPGPGRKHHRIEIVETFGGDVLGGQCEACLTVVANLPCAGCNRDFASLKRRRFCDRACARAHWRRRHPRRVHFWPLGSGELASCGWRPIVGQELRQTSELTRVSCKACLRALERAGGAP